MYTHEVIIAGGGPAGSACAAAILSRRPDLAGRVLILERARHPREKPCGGGLTGHVPAALSALGLRLQVPGVPARTAQVVFGGVRRQVRLPAPVVVVRREEFDDSLLRQAAELGAEVWQGRALRGFAVRDGGVAVETDGGAPLTCRVLVGADGAGSLVRKHILGHRAQGGPHPIRLFRAELPMDCPYGDEMVYDFTPMAAGLRGYLWLFPVPGRRVNVGVMHYQGAANRSPLSGAALAGLCQAHLSRHGIALPSGALRGWPAWGYDPAGALAAPHLCLVGDAAGIDALTGEGIAVALEQGLVAGAAICEGLEQGDLRFADYAARIRRATVGRELSLDRLLARLLYDHRHRAGGLGGFWHFLSMVLYDRDLLDLYARRVSGTILLSEHRRRLLPVLLRHGLALRSRRAQLRAAAAASS
jgi:flavin-dependent dehydrogenase